MPAIKGKQVNDAPRESEAPIEAARFDNESENLPIVTSISDEEFDALANRLARQSPGTWQALAG